MNKIKISITPDGDSYESAANKIISAIESKDCDEQDIKDAIITLARMFRKS